MRATQLMAKGLFGRSMDHIKWQAGVVWNQETIKGAQRPRPLYEWTNDDSIRRSVIMSDEIIGGKSKSHMDFISSESDSTSSSQPSSTPSSIPSSYARFYGNISTALPKNRPEVKRTGLAGFRTPSQAPTIFGRSYWDIDPYTYLAMRIKSDGRSYFVNVQTESVEPTDIHQHRLYAKRPGEWETVLLKWNDFVRTNYGFVVTPQMPLLRQKVRTVGIGLTDRVEGPFELCIERIWATNSEEDADHIVEGKDQIAEIKALNEVADKGKGRFEDGERGAAGGGGLKTKSGTKITW